MLHQKRRIARVANQKSRVVGVVECAFPRRQGFALKFEPQIKIAAARNRRDRVPPSRRVQSHRVGAVAAHRSARQENPIRINGITPQNFVFNAQHVVLSPLHEIGVAPSVGNRHDEAAFARAVEHFGRRQRGSDFGNLVGVAVQIDHERPFSRRRIIARQRDPVGLGRAVGREISAFVEVVGRVGEVAGGFLNLRGASFEAG